MTADTQAQGDLVAQFEAFLRLHGDPSKLSEPMREILRMFYEAGHAADLQGRAQEGEPSDAVDAARYRLLRRGQHWSVLDGIGDTLRGEALDAAIDHRASLAQAQKERQA